MLIDHWAVARQIQEDTGLTTAQILALPADEYARLSRRPTPTESAATALGYADESPGSAASRSPADTPQGVDVSQLSMSEYAAVRGQLGVGGREYGRGALDAGSTADWIAAAQQKAGRSGMQAGNVTEAPRVNGRMPIANQPVQGRAGYYR